MLVAAPQRSGIYEVRCVLGKLIRTSNSYFQYIASFKHKELEGKIKDVLLTFAQAEMAWEEVPGSKVVVYYRRLDRLWLCAVARHLDGEGYLITAYLTRKPRTKGRQLWPKDRKEN